MYSSLQNDINRLLIFFSISLSLNLSISNVFPLASFSLIQLKNWSILIFNGKEASFLSPNDL